MARALRFPALGENELFDICPENVCEVSRRKMYKNKRRRDVLHHYRRAYSPEVFDRQITPVQTEDERTGGMEWLRSRKY